MIKRCLDSLLRWFTVTLLALSLTGNATAGGWSQPAKIESLDLDSNGVRLFVRFSNSVGNPEGCDQTDLYVVRLDTVSNPDRMLSFLMSAFHAQNDVKLFLGGCVPVGTYGFSSSRPWIGAAIVER